MGNDRITEYEDWRDGMNSSRENTNKRLKYLEAQLDMLISRIKDLEQPPKAPHPPKQEEEMKL